MKAHVDLIKGTIELTDEYGFRVDCLEFTSIYIVTKSEKEPEKKVKTTQRRMIRTGCFVN